jgi:hypothetical protein
MYTGDDNVERLNWISIQSGYENAGRKSDLVGSMNTSVRHATILLIKN